MPLIAIDDIFSIIADCRLNGQQILTTLHYKVSAIELSDDVEYLQFCQDFFDQLETDGLPEALSDVQSVDLDYLRWGIQRIHPVRLVQQFFEPTIESGHVVTAALPQNVAAVVTIRGDLAERSNISNKHIAGVPAESVENGLLKPAYITDMTALGEAMILDIEVTSQGNTIDLHPIIFHRTAPTTLTIPTSVVVGTATRIERRRTVGVGS